jgi:outer membrane receptor protein involved in Fe transport
VSYNINPQDLNSHPYYAGYFQDQWRATRNLTLTLGLRYNVELGSKEKSDHYVYLDTTSPSPLSVPGYNLVGRSRLRRGERTVPACRAGRLGQLGSACRSRLSNRRQDGAAGRLRNVPQSTGVP